MAVEQKMYFQILLLMFMQSERHVLLNQSLYEVIELFRNCYLYSVNFLTFFEIPL